MSRSQARRPLPVREGLNPSRVLLPRDSVGTVLEHLVARFPTDAARLAEKVSAGEVVDDHGCPITDATPMVGGAFIHLYRDPPPETPVPFELEILHHDADLLVIDKPHFLASTPRGQHVVETALVRLRRQFDNPLLVPAHRLDRLTAGVLMFTCNPAARRPYQELFAGQSVRKIYEAVSDSVPRVELPLLLRSRMVKDRGNLQAVEIDGEPNAETYIEQVADHRFILRPRTGKTHQLRVHLDSIGAPILGDPLYPAVTLDAAAPTTFTDPLQLLARSLEFKDPLTGALRRFESGRVLKYW
ncbi:pseudouridine synthase [Tomitella biformata]|uniref:pseudouridine synthase n=1 Tax=Tomitella biformata TaxID=630403 RepID=UPI00046722C4|nr:pseudouridine synthase [Tomitella biformata]